MSATAVENELVIRVDKLECRYKDAYTVANFVNGLAEVVKIGSLLAGLGVIVLDFVWNDRGSVGVSPFLIMGIVAGGLIGVVGYVWGVMIAARGQMLLAAIDGAVNSSTLLSNTRKAEILGVRD